MKMSVFIIVALGGLAGCGWLVFRHHRRVSLPAPTELVRPVDVWQRKIRLDPVRPYRTDEQLREKLRREEERQRPQEGRN